MKNLNATCKLKHVKSGKEIALTKPTSSVGRDKESDLILDSEQGYPSRMHAQLYLKSGKLFVDDLLSTNGTFVNNSRISKVTEVHPGDILKFANEEFYVLNAVSADDTVISNTKRHTSMHESFIVVEEDLDPEQTAYQQDFPLPAGWPVDNTFSRHDKRSNTQKNEQKQIDQLLAKTLSDSKDLVSAALIITSKYMEPLVFPLSHETRPKKWRLGRHKNCDIVIDLPSISEHHANLMFLDNQWLLEDCQSTNGISLNGERQSEIYLKQGAQLSLGQVDLHFREVAWAV